MGRPYDFEYRESGSVGTMICGACNKAITSGQYRCYKRSKSYDWYYVTHHRECCADDPAWAKLDQQKKDHINHNIALLDACKKFRDKWKIDDLDQLIDDLNAFVESLNEN